MRAALSRLILAETLTLLCLIRTQAQPLPEWIGTIERDVATLLLVGARGADYIPGGEFDRLICGLKVGGLILFDKDVEKKGAPRNIRSKKQLTRLTEKLQERARLCENSPLLIAIDLEGGVVNRLRSFPELRKTKSHAQLGKGSPRRTYDEALRMARVMHFTGINWTLAPVVDVNLNPQNPVIGRYGRSFSSDPETVTRHAHSFIRGLHAYDILNCIKHFPGHGSSLKDSHLEAVDVTKTSRPEIELFPFRMLIQQGAPDCVMTAHIYDKNLDPDAIVTFSSRALTGLLRNTLGFKGVIISDDLQMEAVIRRHSLTDAAVLAIEAGNDMIIVSNNRIPYDPALPQTLHTALLNAVHAGTIPREQIHESAKRIRRMKTRLLKETPQRRPSP